MIVILEMRSQSYRFLLASWCLNQLLEDYSSLTPNVLRSLRIRRRWIAATGRGCLRFGGLSRPGLFGNRFWSWLVWTGSKRARRYGIPGSQTWHWGNGIRARGGVNIVGDSPGYRWIAGVVNDDDGEVVWVGAGIVRLFVWIDRRENPHETEFQVTSFDLEKSIAWPLAGLVTSSPWICQRHT